MTAGPSRNLKSPSALTVIAAIILVASEVLTAAIAGAWAIAGLLKFGDIFFWALEIVMVGLALAAITSFARRALKVEPIFPAKR